MCDRQAVGFTLAIMAKKNCDSRPEPLAEKRAGPKHDAVRHEIPRTTLDVLGRIIYRRENVRFAAVDEAVQVPGAVIPTF